MNERPRRIRVNEKIRKLTRETRVSPSSLVLPIFIRYGNNVIEDISSLDGQKRYSVDTVVEGVRDAINKGIKSFMLFGIPEDKDKDEIGSGAYDENGIVQQGIRVLKKAYGDEIFIITDVCLCEYTSHGHCGLIVDKEVHNDNTLELLAKTALSHALAGCDMVAPSDMMDNRILAIRKVLDENNFESLPIMSYSAKYASSFYGPFREAAGSAPEFGDRKAYQMDYHNSKEAIKEVILDVEQGSDIVMVKPALSYLDIISKVSDKVELPVAAYSVSGEYAMIKSAAKNGLVDEYKLMCETAISIYRAGADILITYYAKELADAMRKGDIG